MQTQTNTQVFTARAIDFYVKSATCASEEAAAYYKAQAEKYERFAAGALEAPSAPAVAKAAAPATKSVKARCAHYKAIQTFFAIARDAGLDTSATAKPRMRHAMETFMGRCVDSRSEVTAAEWIAMGAAIKSKKLFW
jgi:hypothetical protein